MITIDLSILNHPKVIRSVYYSLFYDYSEIEPFTPLYYFYKATGNIAVEDLREEKDREHVYARWNALTIRDILSNYETSPDIYNSKIHLYDSEKTVCRILLHRIYPCDIFRLTNIIDTIEYEIKGRQNIPNIYDFIESHQVQPSAPPPDYIYPEKNDKTDKINFCNLI